MTRRAEASKGQHDSAPARPRSAGETPAIPICNLGVNRPEQVGAFVTELHEGLHRYDHDRDMARGDLANDASDGFFHLGPVIHFSGSPLFLSRANALRQDRRRRDCESPSLMGLPVFVENKDGPGAFPYGGKITAPDAKLPAGERDEQS